MLLRSVWRTLPSCAGIWLGTTGRPIPVEGVWPSSLIPARHAADPGKKLIPPMNSSEVWGRERGLLLPEPELADSGSFPPSFWHVAALCRFLHPSGKTQVAPEVRCRSNRGHLLWGPSGSLWKVEGIHSDFEAPLKCSLFSLRPETLVLPRWWCVSVMGNAGCQAAGNGHNRAA